MTAEEYFDSLAAVWDGEFVVCALGESANGWWNATHSDVAYYMHGAMGFASSFALGLALAAPERRVWALDSDGGLAMNLGGLLTEASLQPVNLTHVVLNNHCYQSLRGTPLVNGGRTDYASVARAAGIADVHEVSEPADLVRCVQARDRHTLIIADVAPRRGGEGRFEQPPPLPFEGPEIKYRFGRHTERELGRPVFGPRGY